MECPDGEHRLFQLPNRYRMPRPVPTTRLLYIPLTPAIPTIHSSSPSLSVPSSRPPTAHSLSSPIPCRTPAHPGSSRARPLTAVSPTCQADSVPPPPIGHARTHRCWRRGRHRRGTVCVSFGGAHRRSTPPHEIRSAPRWFCAPPGPRNLAVLPSLATVSGPHWALPPAAAQQITFHPPPVAFRALHPRAPLHYLFPRHSLPRRTASR